MSASEARLDSLWYSLRAAGRTQSHERLREAVLAAHSAGMSKREIAFAGRMSRYAVQKIIRSAS